MKTLLSILLSLFYNKTMDRSIPKRHWTKLLFLGFGIAIFVLMPHTADAQYFCSGQTYTDSSCTIPANMDWWGCASRDETNICIAESSPAGTAPTYRKATCNLSANCDPLLPLPIVSLAAEPSSIVEGASSTLSWNTSDSATNCTASGAWSGTKVLSGSESVTPKTTSSYTLTCTNAAGEGAATASIEVLPSTTIPPPPPPCGSYGDVDGDKVVTGADVTLINEHIVGNVTLSTQQQLWADVNGDGAIDVFDSISVAQYIEGSTNTFPVCTISPPPPSTLPSPTVDISANPLAIAQGEATTISWASSAAANCTASGSWGGTKSLSGSETATPSITSTYTLTCTSQGGSVSDSVTIAVEPPTSSSGDETTTGDVPAGDTITTDTEGDGATEADPIETDVTTPVAGQVIIVEASTSSSAPAGFSFLAKEVNITAPTGSLGNPIILSFQLDLSLVPAASNPNLMEVFKNRVLVPKCPSNTCVSSIVVSGGDIVITVKTIDASIWNFGFGTANSAATPSVCGDGIVEGLEQCETGDLGEKTCQNSGYEDGTLSCYPAGSAQECRYDVSDCSGIGGLIPCGQLGNPCNFCHLFQLGGNIVKFLLIPGGINNGAALIPILAGLLFALGGFFFFTAGGNLGRLERGKQIIVASVVGLLIIYGAWLFIGLLIKILGFSPGFGLETWWTITCAL